MKTTENRIQPKKDIVDCLIDMSEGNPGAVTCLSKIVQFADIVDPYCAFSYWGPLAILDYLGIYGSSIWILYSDICDQDIVMMIAVLRAVQLGEFNEEILLDACGRQDGSGKDLVPVSDLYDMVKNRTSGFDTLDMSL